MNIIEKLMKIFGIGNCEARREYRKWKKEKADTW